MYIISKTFTFDAAHQLHGLPDGHQCGRLHGHTYSVQINLGGDTLTREGWIRDYGELSAFKQYIDANLDHRNLNEVYAGMQTTAENLARELYFWAKARWPEVTSVSVSETPKTTAMYYEDTQ